jgi:hypothetical protein
MFGLGKKKKPAPKSKAATRLMQQQRGPLKYLSVFQTLDYARNSLEDVRGLEGVALPLVAFIAWRTISSERRKREKNLMAARQAAVRESVPAYLRKSKKRFILF